MDEFQRYDPFHSGKVPFVLLSSILQRSIAMTDVEVKTTCDIFHDAESGFVSSIDFANFISDGKIYGHAEGRVMSGLEFCARGSALHVAKAKRRSKNTMWTKVAMAQLSAQMDYCESYDMRVTKCAVCPQCHRRFWGHLCRLRLDRHSVTCSRRRQRRDWLKATFHALPAAIVVAWTKCGDGEMEKERRRKLFHLSFL